MLTLRVLTLLLVRIVVLLKKDESFLVVYHECRYYHNKVECPSHKLRDKIYYVKYKQRKCGAEGVASCGVA